MKRKHMKFVALVMLLALVSLGAGPCTMFQNAQQTLCNPTPEQKAQAEAAAAFLDMVGSRLPAPLGLGYFVAKGVFLLVKGGICVDFAQLSQAIVVFDQAANKEKTIKAKLGMKKPAIPNIDSLRRAMMDAPNIDTLRR